MEKWTIYQVGFKKTARLKGMNSLVSLFTEIVTDEMSYKASHDSIINLCEKYIWDVLVCNSYTLKYDLIFTISNEKWHIKSLDYIRPDGTNTVNQWNKPSKCYIFDCLIYSYCEIKCTG